MMTGEDSIDLTWEEVSRWHEWKMKNQWEGVGGWDPLASTQRGVIDIMCIIVL